MSDTLPTPEPGEAQAESAAPPGATPPSAAPGAAPSWAQQPSSAQPGYWTGPPGAPSAPGTYAAPPPEAQPGPYGPGPYAAYPAYPGYPGYYPPPGYAPAYGAQRPTNSSAVASLVCGIATFVICPLSAIVAVVLGNQALSRIRASGGMEQGDGMAKAGIVLGWIGIGLMVLFIVVLVIAAVLAPSNS